MTIYYQFLSSKNAISNIERMMIKVSRINKVNDVFELQPYLRLDKIKRNQLKKIRLKICNNYGMVCFSTDWEEPIMWGHYADCNKGIALGFNFISDRYKIKQVHYPEERKKIIIDTDSIAESDYIDFVGFIKYKNWSYEKEHRFFVKLDDCVNIEGNYFLKFNNDFKLKRIIIGPEHPCKNKKNYAQTASYIAELSKKTGAELLVSRAEFGGYRIVRCGLWTPRINKD